MTAAASPGPSQGRSGPSFADASPAEVRAALIPEEAAEFDQQWREVMAAATEAHRAMYRRSAARLAAADIPADEPLPRTKARLGL